MNDAAYSEWKAGELLFENASGRYTPGALPEIIGSLGDIITWGTVSGLSSTNTDNGVLYASIDRKQLIPQGTVYTLSFYKDSALAGTVIAEAINFKSGEETLVSGAGVSIKITLRKDTYDGTFAVKFPFPWEMTYSFAVSSKEDSIVIGGITATDKEGWEYADVFYATNEETQDGDKFLVQRAKYAYFHKVFRNFGFDNLLLDEDTVLPGVR